MTRGRDENHLHVVTESTDPAEARDVLECVHRPRPGRRPRRHPTPRPRPPDPAPRAGTVLASSSRRRSSPTGWRPGEPCSSNSATTSTSYLAHRADRRADAAAELAELQPDLAAARAAWQPYAERIAAIEDELRTDLRPAMWKANHDATHAGFGHRHSASRRANDATERVDDAESSASRRSTPTVPTSNNNSTRSRPRRATSTTSPTHHPPATASNSSTVSSSTGSSHSSTPSTSGRHGPTDGRYQPLTSPPPCQPSPTRPAEHPCSPSTTARSTAPNGSTRSSRSPSCSEHAASNCPAVETLNSNEVPSSASTYDSLGHGSPLDNAGTSTGGTR